MKRRTFLEGAVALAALPACSQVVEDGMKWVRIKTGQGNFYCSQDYYMVNGIRIPLGLEDALKLAYSHNAFLPEKWQVDAIWKAADLKLAPIPMTPGPKMTTRAYWEKHNDLIEVQMKRRMEDLGMTEPMLIAGHKKDILMPKSDDDSRVTIYGWHRLDGRPIQPVSRVHGKDYFDYSHAIRLIRW